MPLTVAVQMDPMESINIAGDSTFALMLSAQARGHSLFHYTADALNYREGRVWAKAHPVAVERVAGKHFQFGEAVNLDLGDEADVVLMRQDPPFDLGYITATHLLERIAEAAGRRGERLAEWWLRLKGWTILDRRVRTPAGEVDLVARRGNLIAFVEVKTRRTAAELDIAIDERRLARVAAAAEVLMARYAGPGDDIRVDVILLAPGTRPRHIENAWIGAG